MASPSNDPRLPSAARPYKPPLVAPQDLPVDYSGFIAVVFGVFGAMFRYKVCSWLAIIFCAQSLSNMRNVENDLKQISMAMMRWHHHHHKPDHTNTVRHRRTIVYCTSPLTLPPPPKLSINAPPASPHLQISSAQLPPLAKWFRRFPHLQNVSSVSPTCGRYICRDGGGEEEEEKQ
ncbi:hypothetical protein BUALT_Bualt07G0070600 [Buddleja alternifolia]|uniref:Protein Asterix n=1 Tax=Buddleja alternifolia TaxID=168488 RepID=A0AAV6XD99_9LAMI|nr:hypothetical protein BUALT_Bualt07G0070600 [Buddleja alternifolia]